MSSCSLVFPNQLFDESEHLSHTRDVVLIEDFLFFGIQTFHVQRLVFLRCAMQRYSEQLREKKYRVHYLEYGDCQKRGAFFAQLKARGYTELHVVDPVDDFLQKDFEAHNEFTFHWYKNPQFYLSEKEISTYFRGPRSWSMAKFYIYQRKQHKIMVDDQGKPLGQSWSFDTENRKKLPKNIYVPPLNFPKKSDAYTAAENYVSKTFPASYGTLTTVYCYPSTHKDAKKWLNEFLEHRFADFGPYQDAMDPSDSFLFHSVLSPLLNVGLLLPQDVVTSALKAAKKNGIPLASLEGFIRQILGWREYIRAAYVVLGRKQRTKNFFSHTRQIPESFWTGQTGIDPIDRTIEKVLETGYANHIERLMLFGNFFLLCEFDPNDVYTWFMSLFVDAYDWVMVPNVYGMSQYADGGLFITKPYVSSSNYILKMGRFPKGDWCTIWDGLFWRFLQKHRPLFENNRRMSMLTKQLDTKKSVLEEKIARANQYLDSL